MFMLAFATMHILSQLFSDIKHMLSMFFKKFCMSKFLSVAIT